MQGSQNPSMPSAPARKRKNLRLRRALVVILVLLIIVSLTLLGVGWYFSQQLLQVSHSPDAYNTRVLAVDPRTVTLESTGDTRRRGTYGIDWSTGHAVLGPIFRLGVTGVMRQISGQTAPITAGTQVHLDKYVFTSPGSLRIRYSTVHVPDPLGPMPGWYVPGRRHTWVVIVHGHDSIRAEGMRPLPTLARFGLPVLDISFRNDVGAPGSPDGVEHLGATEWQDLQAAVRYARAHGAHDVILYGYSEGGGIVESFLHRSSDARYARAIVLDAPALDWNSVVNLAAQQRGIPGFITTVARRVVEFRLGIADLRDITEANQTSSLRAPTLLFHGTADTVVPIGPSIAFAHARPDLVTFYPVAGAEHTGAWNVNPQLYTARLSTFLRRVLR